MRVEKPSRSSLIMILLAFGILGLSWHEAQRATVALPPEPCPNSAPTMTPMVTVTPTPTSMPGPPQLLQPDDGALLPQPVSPQGWYFAWAARTGPCLCSISIEGPGGRHIWQGGIKYPHEYRYTTDEFLPDDALGPWYWSIYIVCGMGSNHSEWYSFWVEPAHRLYLPLVRKQGAVAPRPEG